MVRKSERRSLWPQARHEPGTSARARCIGEELGSYPLQFDESITSLVLRLLTCRADNRCGPPVVLEPVFPFSTDPRFPPPSFSYGTSSAHTESMMLPARSYRNVAIGCITLVLLLSFLAAYHRDTILASSDLISAPKSKPKPDESGPKKLAPGHPGKDGHPRWKFKPEEKASPPIKDNFPLADSGELPPIPSYNQPPDPHVSEQTPLLIGFTRNWRLLQQAVVSYIAAGWPPEDIYVIENTGVMRSNEEGKLTLQNPFYLDHYRLNNTLGVNVVRTPTLLNFSQLQNFFLHLAVEKQWKGYFWSHMDVVALPYEAEKENYKSLYMRAVEVYREVFSEHFQEEHNWAAQWFSYDRLVLVKTQAYMDVGGWDTFISYYMSDCDMHERLRMAGFSMQDARVGDVYDVGAGMDDLLVLYRREPTDDDEPTSQKFGKECKRNDKNYRNLKKKLEKMMHKKNNEAKDRNYWQAKQRGGQGEPFYRYSKGFEDSIKLRMEQGREVFRQKWGYRDCDLQRVGLQLDDAWRVEPDW
jgi:hypothetical protein